MVACSLVSARGLAFVPVLIAHPLLPRSPGEVTRRLGAAVAAEARETSASPLQSGALPGGTRTAPLRAKAKERPLMAKATRGAKAAPTARSAHASARKPARAVAAAQSARRSTTPTKALAATKSVKKVTKTTKAPAKTSKAVKSKAVAKKPAKKTPAKAVKTAKSKAGAAKKAAPASKKPVKPATKTGKAATKVSKAATKASKTVAKAKASAAKPAKPAKPALVPKPAPSRPVLSEVVTRRHRSPAVAASTLDRLRTQLIEELAAHERQAEGLQAEAEALANEREPGDTQFDEESGEGDTLSVERERDLALSTAARQTIDDISKALARMDDGSYGYCEVCGDRIPVPRLEAIPWADQCVKCKSRGERRR
jgi:RNA polymerase-binding protein DksA